MDPQQRLRADNTTIRWVLDSLDAEDPARRPPLQPGQQRYPYRVPSVRVELREAGGTGEILAPTRSIGCDGMSFLVGRLVYPQTACRLDLTTTRRDRQSVSGKVVDCRYIPGTGSIYEADVRFQTPIDVAQFVARALCLRVLLVDDSPTFRQTLGDMLRRLRVDVVACENGKQAVDAALSQHFDLILMDMEMPVLDGFQATARLRTESFAQPIVAVTSLTSLGDRERCLRAGCDDYLAKPPNPKAIQDLVERLRPAPLMSTLLADHPEFAPRIVEFVRELRYQALRIWRAYQGGELAAVQREARQLKLLATAHGFMPIGKAAADLDEAVAWVLPAPDLHVKVSKLVRLCCVARPGAPPPAS